MSATVPRRARAERRVAPKPGRDPKGHEGPASGLRGSHDVPVDRGAAVKKLGVRGLAAQATRDAILKAATKVFAKQGYAGGRVEQISKAAKSYDRMIYYLSLIHISEPTRPY